MIKEYNKIDTQNDCINTIQMKINAMKKAVADGEMIMEEYEFEKNRVMKELEEQGLVGYAFTW